MRLSPLLWLALWVVVTSGLEPETSDHIQQYQLQDGQGSYKFGFKTADQMAEAEGDPNSEVKGKYAYVDKNGDMRGVEYTAGVKGFLPKMLNKEEADASMLVPTILQPNKEDTIPIDDRVKNSRYQNRPGALHYSTREEIEQADETDEAKKSSPLEKEAEKPTNPKTENNQPEATSTTDGEKNKSIKEEIVHGKYTFIEEDGLPATIEYEAGPEIGFVVKSFTKEVLKSSEQVSDIVYNEDGLAVRKENAPRKSAYNEEGTEETYPEGFVRGLYTFTDVDGVSATVEYEAGPKIGFVVKKVSMGEERLDQLGQDTGTLLNTETVRVPSSIQEDSSEEESINHYDNINEKLESLSGENSFTKSKSHVVLDQKHYEDNDPSQTSSFKKYLPTQNNTRIHSLEEKDSEQPNEEEDKEKPMSAAYRFGFSIKDQSRHEKSDSLGNVNGDYSYVDGAGLLTKVEYEAGAKKGFVIKRMTHEHHKAPQKFAHSADKKTQNLSLPEEQNRDKLSTLNKRKQIKNQRESLHETMIDGYEVSPYVLREYVNERNLPIRSELNTESGSLDVDSSVASESKKHFTYVHPEALASDDSYVYKSSHNNEAVRNQYFPQEANKHLPSSTYSLFVRDPSSPDPQEAPTVKNNEYSSYLPKEEPITDDRKFYRNVFNRRVEPYRTESNHGFSVYGPPIINVPYTITYLDPESTRKAGVYKQKQHHKRKKIIKRPANMTNNQNFTSLQPDGSYSFAYKAKDHSREQSIDRNGKVNYRYQINTKRDGNTLVIFSTQVPKDLRRTSDSGTLSQETGKDYSAGI